MYNLTPRTKPMTRRQFARIVAGGGGSNRRERRMNSLISSDNGSRFRRTSQAWCRMMKEKFSQSMGSKPPSCFRIRVPLGMPGCHD